MIPLSEITWDIARVLGWIIAPALILIGLSGLALGVMLMGAST